MKRNESFVLRAVYDRYILMPVCSNSIGNDPILLNEVAAFIWNTAAFQVHAKDVLEKTGQHYHLLPDSPELLAVKKFIEQMVKVGLLIEEEGKE